MIKKVLTGLEINEKDNGLTAFAKAAVETSINRTLVVIGIASTLYVVGKTVPKKEVKPEQIQETEEEVVESL